MKKLLATIGTAAVLCSCAGGSGGEPEKPYAGQTLLNQHMADQKHHIGVVVGDIMHPNADAYYEAAHIIGPYIESYK